MVLGVRSAEAIIFGLRPSIALIAERPREFQRHNRIWKARGYPHAPSVVTTDGDEEYILEGPRDKVSRKNSL
jgi:hypothetical protein